MKSKFLKLLPVFLFLLPLGLVLPGTGCDKNEPDPPEEICDYMPTETDPAKLIIGEWQHFTKGENNPEDVVYWEFNTDSLATTQYYSDDGVFHSEELRYWVDSLLHFGIETGFPLTPWYYEFSDNCTLELDGAFLSLTSVHWTLKRTKE